MSALEESGNLAIFLAGEVDMHSAEVLERALERAADARPPVLIIDCTQISFMGTAGLYCFLRAHKRAATTGSRVVVRNMAPLVRRTFEIAKLGHLLTDS